MNTLKLLSVFLFAVLLLASCTESDKSAANQNDAQKTPDSTTTNSAPEVKDDIAEGKRHFASNCANCHRDDGTGGPIEIEGEKIKPEDLTTAKMIKEPDSEYLEYMEKGIPDEGMPSFKDVLSEEEMKQVVKYIRKELQKQ